MEIVKPRLSCVKLDPDPYWQKQLEKNSWTRIRKKLIRIHSPDSRCEQKNYMKGDGLHIIALRNPMFYFCSNIELTWHECSFMPQITTYKEKIESKFL